MPPPRGADAVCDPACIPGNDKLNHRGRYYSPGGRRGKEEKKMVELKYDANGLIPCIVQDEKDGAVLMMAWMNEESVKRTLEDGTTWFWSRSRQEFWNKGATSGSKQIVKKMYYDCDADCLLAVVEQLGSGACHTGERTCFFRELTK